MCRKKWGTFAPGRGITIATLFSVARSYGYQPRHEHLDCRAAHQTENTDRDQAILILPSNVGMTITESTSRIYSRIAPSHQLFNRCGHAMRLEQGEDGTDRLAMISPTAFCSIVERFGRPHVYRADKDGKKKLVTTICAVSLAERMLACETVSQLPPVRGITACPLITESEGQLCILKQGYHSILGGVLVTGGGAPEDLPIDNARDALELLVAEFQFQTPGDRSRAIASMLTPALKLGGFIRGPIPIDVAEADFPQAGKTFRQKLIAALYGESPATIARRDRGVGGIDESIQEALLAGRPFVQLDNVRGPLNSQFLEMVVTAEGIVGVRVPYHAEVRVDTRHFFFFVTSNGVETTRDLAMRSSIVRIRKRPGHVFRQFPEGDLLAHVRANQPFYLGAVFSIIRAWWQRGGPTIPTTQHDFRCWAGILDWIVHHLFSAAPLLDGHEAAQVRVGNPAQSWLRSVALAVQAAGRLGEDMSASSIAALCEEETIPVPDSGRDNTDARLRRVGSLMARVFHETAAHVTIDEFTVTRGASKQYNKRRQGFIPMKVYTFTRTTGDKVPS